MAKTWIDGTNKCPTCALDVELPRRINYI